MSETEKTNYRRRSMLQEMAIGPLWICNPLKDRKQQATLIADAEQGTAATKGDALPSLSPVMIAPSPSAASDPVIDATALSDAEIAEMDWASLQSSVATCTRCALCSSRNRTVFGIGDQRARWMLIGEGPGRSEDQQGEPFVGPAGKLLDNMLQAIDLQRGENNYVANVVKCRPTDATGRDRAPTPEEAAACRPYLDRQIALVQPAVIIALGKVAALSLLAADPKTAVAAMRGVVHRRNDIALVVTYHPAYLLRKPLDKALSWQDLCLARQAADSAADFAVDPGANPAANPANNPVPTLAD